MQVGAEASWLLFRSAGSKIHHKNKKEEEQAMPEPLAEELFHTVIKSFDANGDISPTETAQIIGHRSEVAIWIILDPRGEDHDILIERHPKEWRIYINPRGGNPLCIARLGFQRSTLENDADETLISQDF
jgi:hypothetical protein